MEDERVKVDILVPEPRKKQHYHHTHSSVPRGMSKKRGRRDGPRDEDRPETVMTFLDGRTTTDNNNYYNRESNPFSSVIDDSSSASGHLLSPRPSSDLAGRGCSNGPEPELDHLSSSAITGTHTNSEVAEQVAREGQEDEENQTLLNPEKHSFSLALKECQNRHCRSEEDPLPEQRRRPISLDFGSQGSDASVSSPLSYIAGGSMKKSYTVAKSGMFPSPGAPIYRHSHGAAVGYSAKGWSSERVPLPVSNPGRWHGSGSKSLFVPFGNGRTLPSKWEDAEKWILSPVSGDGVGVKNQTVPLSHRRRPKSKSGPLGSPAGTGSYAVASPPVRRNSVASPPLMTGALVADHGCCGHGGIGRGGGGGSGGGGGRSCSSATQSDHCMVRSASMHGWSELLDSSSLPSSQDENSDSTKDAFPVLPVVSMKDMATQMSPNSSDHSSPREKPISSPSSPPTSKAIPEPQSHSLEFEVRDVQVDNRVTITRWSKKHLIRALDKDSTSIKGWKKKTMDSRTSAWESTETVKCVAKLNREEVKITAWETLQKAKADAAIRKLEMKLEKKRASSMEKISRKLKRAQRLAEEMRNMVAAVPCKASQDVTTTKRAIFSHWTGQLRSLSGCFTCHAF